MHELSLATALVEQVCGVLQRESASEVLSLQLAIGAYSGVEIEPFEFCFPLAAEGTPLAGAALEIERVPVRVFCSACGAETTPELPMIACRDCGALAVEVISGKEFNLRSIEVR